ncbi:glycosyltransferase [Bdellovibrio reynosensis]|uniref:Glycosyltransferase n=1 Tax=Bdellovibrio reynosensis TaxID=2835041 RepID=A0ABY4CDA6_9BACT|nr:glycosyltransferase [Bdellovibrio reynosensis]UOF01847.1 glycosyltransferase [Bdellovibrio reynosensis]
MNLKNDLLTGQDLIVFGEDFARHPHSLEHLLRPLFGINKIIWVETIGLRSPRFSVYDLKRIYGKLKGWFGPKKPSEVRLVPQDFWIVAPLMIPFNQWKLIRSFNTWSVKRAVNKVLREQGFKNPITVTSVPNACDYVGEFAEKLKIYVCVDEFSLWPGLDYKMVQTMEAKLLSKADVVFATSESLKNNKSNGKKETILLTHGVDFEHFNIGSKAFSENLNICYFGLLDERSDQSIIQTIATQSPAVKIHIIGNVVCDVEKLRAFKNIIFHGPVGYRALPDAIKEMDVFILPYVRSELTENLNPLKLKEYLSTGRPTIATPLPEVVKFSEHLILAHDGKEFVSAIKNLRKFDSAKSAHTIEMLKSNETWQAKARIFSRHTSLHLGVN